MPWNFKTILTRLKKSKFTNTIIEQLSKLQEINVFVLASFGSIGLFIALAFIGTLVDFMIAPAGSFHLSRLNQDSLNQLVSAISRSSGQFLGTALTCMSIALPVTANLYTPRLILLFVTDRYNLAMMALVLITLVQNVLTHHGLRMVDSIYFSFYFTYLLFFLSVSLLLVYFGHMVRYFNPSFIFLRLEKDTLDLLNAIHKSPHTYQNSMRVRILINLNNIGNMVLKSIGRSDGEVASAGIYVLKQLLDHYASIKHEMPNLWQELDYSRFTGMSSDGLQEVNKRKIWFELLILRYLSQAFSSSLNVLRELAFSIAEQNHHIGLTYLMQNDIEVVALCKRSFNTYLSQATDRRDVVTVQNVLFHYRLFAEVAISFDQNLVHEIGRHMRFHGHRASKMDLPRVLESTMYDLIHLTDLARAMKDKTAYNSLCKTLLSFSIPQLSQGTLEFAKAKLTFGAVLQLAKDDDHFELLLPQLEEIPDEILALCREELLIRNEKIQNEITDRFINFAYSPPYQKNALLELFHQLETPQEAMMVI